MDKYTALNRQGASGASKGTGLLFVTTMKCVFRAFSFFLLVFFVDDSAFFSFFH
jgi:hypothetical protein